MIILSAFAVLRHAELLAARLGEPLGTVILTLSVTGIEVMMIAAFMYTGSGNAALARDAMFAVVMIVLNGMVGLSLLLDGLRYHEQTYNLQGSNAFLAVIVPLAVLGLVMPNYTISSPGPTYSTHQSVFLIIMSLGLYGVFLAIQNLRHRDYFVTPHRQGKRKAALLHLHEPFPGAPVRYHTALLTAYPFPSSCCLNTWPPRSITRFASGTLRPRWAVFWSLSWYWRLNPLLLLFLAYLILIFEK